MRGMGESEPCMVEERKGMKWACYSSGFFISAKVSMKDMG